ncbi:FAD-dependent monooxygenase [Nocardioides sp. CFH 31398]|uniref:FAD-dependent monooxygenase n=1 Tax=Nocardioides sp. CFH 31398 TaxID=2919579 RepID=UPI001F057EBA|nr:FAD-dependent monooxygenase [Nocardioides sp. CFH 31398]MCH1868179.1 FAD-dependent monooxygenase [Nocardioides sp. CFH 31398]
MTGTARPAPRVLVTGASIAGPTLAWGLDRAGFEVTLLERSPEPRRAGQNIDVRGLGREVVRRMGLEGEVMANLTGEKGTRFVDRSGSPYAVFPRTEGQDGPTAEVEILRGALAGILMDRVPAGVEVRYGDHVVGAEQDAAGVDVDLASGRRERYDLLLVAEGRSSRTRRLLLGDTTTYRERGVTLTFGTLDRVLGDTDFWDWYTATGGRVASMRPDNLGTIRATLSFTSPPMGFERLPLDAQLIVLRERFAGAGWQAERILDGFAARPEEFYSQRMEQVVLRPWSRGRVALVGDAAWGSGPTGMGTTLALVGAHVLTGELAADRERGLTSPAAAFGRYERLLRRYVDSAQGLPPGGARLVHPASRLGVRGIQAMHRVTASRPVRRLFTEHLLTSETHEPVLPDYPFAGEVGASL